MISFTIPCVRHHILYLCVYTGRFAVMIVEKFVRDRIFFQFEVLSVVGSTFFLPLMILSLSHLFLLLLLLLLYFSQADGSMMAINNIICCSNIIHTM